jgi:putative hydrolase of the HAD superfamily
LTGVPDESRIDAIICDIGDVLILFDPNVPADIEKRHGLPCGLLLQTTLKSPSARLASVGQLSHGEWYRRICQSVPREAVDEWLAHHGTLNRPLVDLLGSAQTAGVKLVLLSNATGRLWDDLEYHGVRGLTEWIFCSADIGLAKPDIRVYHLVAEKAALTLGRTLYVDDTPSWVEVGRELGMRGHVYLGVDELRRELPWLGVTR